MKKIVILLFIFLLNFISFSETSEDVIKLINPGKSYIGKIVDEESKKQGVSSDVILSVLSRESGFRNLPPNKWNASGIAQMKPEAFKNGLLNSGMSEKTYNNLLKNKYGGDINKMRADEGLSIKSATGHLKYLKKYYNGDEGKAILSYNMGQGNANALLNNGRNSNKINPSTRVKEEGKHYIYDISEKEKIFKKAKEKGINSLTEREKGILKNSSITKKEYKDKWKDSLNRLDKKENKFTRESNNGNYSNETTNPTGGGNDYRASYKTDIKFDFDSLAETISMYIENGVKKIGNTPYVLLSLLFGIQFLWDLTKHFQNNNIQAVITGTIIKRGLSFTVSLITIKSILSGKFQRLVFDFAFEVTKTLSRAEGVAKINNIWNYKNEIMNKVFQAFSTIWGYSSLRPSEFGKDLIATIIILIVALLISIAFFFIIFDVFKLIIEFKIVTYISTVFLAMGQLDATKDFYNIGKIISTTINFIVKIVAINTILLISVKFLLESSFLDSLEALTLTEILTGQGFIFIMIIYIIHTLISKIDISF